jgi:hypothetical protein
MNELLQLPLERTHVVQWRPCRGVCADTELSLAVGRRATFAGVSNQNRAAQSARLVVAGSQAAAGAVATGTGTQDLRLDRGVCADTELSLAVGRRATFAGVSNQHDKRGQRRSLSATGRRGLRQRRIERRSRPDWWLQDRRRRRERSRRAGAMDPTNARATAGPSSHLAAQPGPAHQGGARASKRDDVC